MPPAMTAPRPRHFAVLIDRFLAPLRQFSCSSIPVAMPVRVSAPPLPMRSLLRCRPAVRSPNADPTPVPAAQPARRPPLQAWRASQHQAIRRRPRHQSRRLPRDRRDRLAPGRKGTVPTSSRPSSTSRLRDHNQCLAEIAPPPARACRPAASQTDASVRNPRGPLRTFLSVSQGLTASHDGSVQAPASRKEPRRERGADRKRGRRGRGSGEIRNRGERT